MAISINGSTGITATQIQGLTDLINTGNTTLGDASSDSVTLNGGTVNIAASGAPLNVGSMAGSITLPGTLDRIRITTVNGTDTFDAGSVNIMYE